MINFHIPAKFRKRVTEIFTSRIAFIIYSVLIAFSLWLFISARIYPTTAKTIRGIDVTVNLPASSDTNSEYQLEKHTVEKINIVIEANRTQIGNLTADDFTATVDASGMTEPGTKELPITVTCNKDITYVLSDVSNSKDTVTIDKLETKEIGVSVDAPKIKAENGYMLQDDAGVCTPETVTIQGPSQLLRQISEARVTISESRKLTSSYTTYSDNIKYYDENGAEVDDTDIKTVDVTEFIVSFNVMQEKDLDLTYQLLNKPTDFDEDWFRKLITISPEEITLASSGKSLNDLESWDLGTISLNDIGMDYAKSVSIDVPDDYTDVSEVKSASLEIDNKDLEKTEVTINDISVMNAPVGYTDFEVTTPSLTVTLIGQKDQIEKITSSDVVASVNLAGYTIQSYTFSSPVTISFKNFNRVWAYGTYEVSVTCKELTTNETSISDDAAEEEQESELDVKKD